MSLSSYFRCVLFSSILFFLACNKQPPINDLNAFRSKLTFELGNQIYSYVDEEQSPFNITSGSKGNFINGGDSSRITIIKGLGEIGIGSLIESRRSRLYISLIRTFNSYFLLPDKFQSWLGRGQQAFLRDGRMENGVGVIWFDEQGTFWTSGTHIGEFGLTKGELMPIEALPTPENFQAPSSFSITSSKAVEPKPGYDYSQQVRIEFKVTLYNANGDSLVINNGIFETQFDVFRN